jgi:error-prone DNA polymerase
MEDLSHRTGVTTAQMESLATAGALGGFGRSGRAPSGGMTRREALWAAGAVAQAGPSHLQGVVVGAKAPPLPEMTPVEANRADLWATSLSPDSYPTEFVRAELTNRGVVTAAALAEVADRSRVTVGGMVTHRQRPATAQGTLFVNLEDETGLINVICTKGVWLRYRRVARCEPALVVHGKVEKVDGVVNVLAERIEALRLSPTPMRSRDFR